MKRAFWGLMLAAIVSATGCCSMNCGGCGSGCGDGGCADGNCADGNCGGRGHHGGGHHGGVHPRLAGLHHGMHGDAASPDMGGPTAAIAYPYYTNRGPRDFLEPNPPTIGR